jgi:hypothetical protein
VPAKDEVDYEQMKAQMEQLSSKKSSSKTNILEQQQTIVQQQTVVQQQQQQQQQQQNTTTEAEGKHNKHLMKYLTSDGNVASLAQI